MRKPEPKPEKFFFADPALPEFIDLESMHEWTGLVPTLMPDENATEVNRLLTSEELSDPDEPDRL